MTKIERRREEFLKDKNLNVKVPMAVAFDEGYKKGLEDAALEFRAGGWIAKAFKIRDLWKREEE